MVFYSNNLVKSIISYLLNKLLSGACVAMFSGSQPKPQKPAATDDTNKEPVEKSSVPPPKKRIDINEPRICKNKGCGKSYKEKDNHDSACDYHPGPAVFHDRMRGVCICSKLYVDFLPL
jgi:hypothetical protein